MMAVVHKKYKTNVERHEKKKRKTRTRKTNIFKESPLKKTTTKRISLGNI